MYNEKFSPSPPRERESERERCSAPIPLLIGVYQGDPLSPVIFNTVMSTLTDSLRSSNSCGYTISSLSTNVLLHADAAMVGIWPGMRAKIACVVLCISDCSIIS